MSGRRWGLALLAGVALAAPLVAQDRTAYERGLDAVRAGDWATVRSAMEEAVRQDPEEKARVRLYGMRFVSYLPHFHLGTAHFELGNCAAALRHWEISEGQGVIQGFSRLHRALEQGRSTCRERLAQEPPPEPEPRRPEPVELAEAIAEAERQTERARRKAAEVAELRRDPSLSGRWQQEEGLGGAETRAREGLEAAERALDGGRSAEDLEELWEAARLAAASLADWEGVERRALERRAALEVERRAAERRAQAPAPEPVAPRPEGVAAATASPPPEELRRAVGAYFTGRYDEALEALGRMEAGADPRVQAQAYLFRAASLHALYRRGGGRDRTLLDRARAAARGFLDLEAGLRPDSALFPPTFVAFLDSL